MRVAFLRNIYPLVGISIEQQWKLLRDYQYVPILDKRQQIERQSVETRLPIGKFFPLIGGDVELVILRLVHAHCLKSSKDVDCTCLGFWSRWDENDLVG